MMFTAIGTLLVFAVLFGVFLFFARRILRMAVKLAFVGAVIFSLSAGTIVGLWRGWFRSAAADRPTVQSTQRANSNRRR